MKEVIKGSRMITDDDMRLLAEWLCRWHGFPGELEKQGFVSRALRRCGLKVNAQVTPF
jgi:hypothetical protein